MNSLISEQSDQIIGDNQDYFLMAEEFLGGIITNNFQNLDINSLATIIYTNFIDIIGK